MRRLLLEGGGRREHEARRMIRVGGRVETTMWQTPTLLQRCRPRRWWPARKKKQLEVVVVVVGANGPVVTSLRPRWCQQRLGIVAAAGQTVRRCAPDPPPKTNLHLHHPETSQDFITTNQKRLDEFMNLFFFLLLPLVGPLPLQFSKGIDDPSSHGR